MVIRRDDGTAWKGHVCYESVGGECKSKLSFDEKGMPPIEEIYQFYGVCPALYITADQFTSVGKIDSLYKFLYGCSLNQLMEVTEGNASYSSLCHYLNEPKEWTIEKVESIDWDLFCVVYYKFLFSDNTFLSGAWEVLSYILETLKTSSGLLALVLSECGRKCDDVTISDFWETVYDGLQTKIIKYMHAETCYTAFCAMKKVQTLFPIERYKAFKLECFSFFDEIARARIAEAWKKKYTLREIDYFDVEELFFYKEYFAFFPESENTKQYVTYAAFGLVYRMADKFADRGQVLGADRVYELALEYAQTDADKDLISSKRNKIAASVSVAKAEQEKVQREQEKKREKERRKDKATDKIAKILAIVFLVSVVTTVLFGLLTLLGVFEAFSKVVLIVSLCIMVPFLIILAVVAIQDKRK